MRLTLLQVVRDINVRENIKTIDLTRNYKLAAAYIMIQVTGEVPAEMCGQCVAGEGPFQLCVAHYGRCANCCHRSIHGYCSFTRNTKEDENVSSVDSRDNQAEEEETGGVKKPAPLESGAASKPSQLAAKDPSKSDSVPVPDVQSASGVGEGCEHHPEPTPVHEVGGRQLRARARQPAPRNPQPPQKRQKNQSNESFYG